MKYLITSLFCFSFLSGCAATYVPPVENANVLLSKSIQSDKDTIFKAVKRTLALNGEQIGSVDYETGVIVTVPKAVKLRPEMADCGKRWA